MKDYQYTDLSGPRMIRVLELQTQCAKFDDTIQVSLHEVSLDDDDKDGSYAALSYAWGNPSLSAEVLCHGRRLAINENLLVALRYLRLIYSNHRRPHLWTDAVCINQANFEERGAQVSMMHTIFARAHTVLAWIGEANAETGHAMDEMKKAAVYGRPVLSRIAGTHGELPAEPDSIDFGAIIDGFLSRPFFERLWVQRESSFPTPSIGLLGT